MSDSILISIGKAVVDELNNPTAITVADYVFTEFSQRFRAERLYDAERPLQDTEILRVDVILGDIDQKAESRNSQSGEYRVDIGFRQIIEKDKIENIDALGMFVEEVGDYFFYRGKLLNFPDARWIKGNVTYPYLPGKLRENSQFVSMLRLTYKVVGR